jgi:aryl-alcohol dehydrogenase-like predicted oxidoreductase
MTAHMPREDVAAPARPRMMVRTRRGRSGGLIRAPRGHMRDAMPSPLPAAALGRSRLPVTRLGLGLAALGRPGYINLGRARDLPPDRTPDALYARSAEILDASCDAGIGYVDTARSYGRAEEFLARWLAARQVTPGAVTLGSKWGYRYTANWAVDAAVHEQKELTRARFEEQLVESRALLGAHLALYQIHSATAESGCLQDPALLAALVAGRRAGHYRAVGLTLSGPASARTLVQAMAARVDGEPVFDTVQATFNCLEPSLAPVLAEAHAAGLGVIVKEMHANGRLTPANTRPDDAALCARLGGLASELGTDLAGLAVAFVLAHPFVDVALSGAATTAQLAAHLGAVELTLDDGARTAIVAAAEPPARYWTTRAGLAWI